MKIYIFSIVLLIAASGTVRAGYIGDVAAPDWGGMAATIRVLAGEGAKLDADAQQQDLMPGDSAGGAQNATEIANWWKKAPTGSAPFSFL